MVRQISATTALPLLEAGLRNMRPPVSPGSAPDQIGSSGNLATPLRLSESASAPRRDGFAPFTRISRYLPEFGENAPYLGWVGEIGGSPDPRPIA